jgi:ABC-type lipoprotein release transport system permease subunit
MFTLFKMAFRDLGRNRRRSFFSALALGMGLSVLLLMAGVVTWELNSSMDKSIQLQSGHLQVRAKTYDENKSSLAYEDLIENPDAVAAQISTLDPVKVATPRLFASGIAVSGDESIGVRVIGIDTTSAANAPILEGMVIGQYLTAEDSSGILIGQTLADKLGLAAGSQLNLLVNTSNGEVQEQLFTIRGIYTTHTPGYDQSVVFLPMAKAQAITSTANHASTIFILLNETGQTDAVAAAIQTGQFEVITFEQMNQLLVQFNEYSNGFMIFLYMIVLAITATVIVNTLVMAVFERTREIGILAAIGMKSGSIMTMFFIESALLAFGGIIIGLILGGIMVFLMSTFGFPVGNFGITGFLLGDRIYAQLTVNDVVTLSLTALAVTLVASLYPALLAARLEPVDALRGGQ